MKITKTLVILGLIIGITGVAFGAKKIVNNYLQLPENSSFYVHSDVIDREGLNWVYKFVDGNATCYITHIKINGIPANASISCLK